MNEMDALVEEVLKELLLDVALIGKYFAVESTLVKTCHTLGSLSSTFAGVRQNVSTSPISLHSR